MVTRFFQKPISPAPLTVPEWLVSARNQGVQTWVTAARKRAAVVGEALVWRADGSLVVFRRANAILITRRTYKEGTWTWSPEPY